MYYLKEFALQGDVESEKRLRVFCFHNDISIRKMAQGYIDFININLENIDVLNNINTLIMSKEFWNLDSAILLIDHQFELSPYLEIELNKTEEQHLANISAENATNINLLKSADGDFIHVGKYELCINHDVRPEDQIFIPSEKSELYPLLSTMENLEELAASVGIKLPDGISFCGPNQVRFLFFNERPNPTSGSTEINSVEFKDKHS